MERRMKEMETRRLEEREEDQKSMFNQFIITAFINTLAVAVSETARSSRKSYCNCE
jgi:hypothetical protein